MRKASHTGPLVLSAIVATSVAILILVVAGHSALAQTGPFGGLRPPAAGGIGGWLIAKQAIFYRALAGMIRSAKTDGSALWGLLGISFAYGIFHAAGPGHGKAVISSYLFANEETWRRGITLSFAAAVMQASTAVAIVGVAAVLLGATAKLMGDTVRVIEIVSYGLIALLGARLIWVKGLGLLKAIRALRIGDKTAGSIELHDHVHGHHNDDEQCHHHDHAHDHSHTHDLSHAEGEHRDHCHDHLHDEEPDVLPWGHAHGPEPDELAGPGGWHRGVSAVISVGLRPCSGAIIVLVFALAQGMFWAGVASTFVMGIGTAITVGTIATLAIGAKALAKRFASDRIGYGSVLVRGAEVGAAALVLAFGVLLLTGYMVSERMVGF
ncbi:MAG: nickel/cobalt transporter [Xanthobacteraceae bacterium]